MTLSTFQLRLRERLTDLGISARAASIDATGSPELIRNYMRGKARLPNRENLEKIASVLQTTPEWLLGQSHVVEGRKSSKTRSKPETRLPSDVPVLGSAAASSVSGMQQHVDAIVDYKQRPPGLVGARDLYAVYVSGDSMAPEHKGGNLRFVWPHKPYRVGDTVVVQEVDGQDDQVVLATIGHYLGRDHNNYLIGKLNPESVLKIPAKRVKAVHKVLETDELFGA